MTQERYILATSFWTRLKGLLGSTRAEIADCILLIAPCRSIHTYGMGYEIDVAFVDEDGVVLRAERDVPRCRTLKCRQAKMVLERANAADKPWFTRGDQIPIQMRFATKKGTGQSPDPEPSRSSE